MIKYVSDLWNSIHRTRIVSGWVNLFFIKNFFITTKAVNSDLVYFILSFRGLKSKKIKTLWILKFTNYIFFATLLLVFISLFLFIL